MTSVAKDDNVCHVCGFTGCGLGIGFTHAKDKDPKWLCVSCSLLIEDIRRVKRMDAYELRAREGGVEAAGTCIEKWGTDLSEYTDEQAAMLAGAIWKGCANRLRDLIRGEAPF